MLAAKMKTPVKIYTEDGEIAAEFYTVSRRGDRLVIDGKALGVMRMDMIMTPGEVLRTFRLVASWAIISFLLLIPYFALRGLFARTKH